MRRLLRGIHRVVMNETTIGIVDAILLCLGLTATIAAAVPAMIAVRRSRRGR